MQKQRRQSSRVIAYKNCFSTKDGKLVLSDLCRSHYMMGTTVGDDGKDQLREGERNVVLRILAFLNFSEESLLELIKEESNEST